MELRAQMSAWPLAAVFTISRGSKSQAEVVVAEIERDSVVGRGECVPYDRYGETVAGVLDTLREAGQAIAAGQTADAVSRALPPGAARNALDCALWDLRAKVAGSRVWEIAGCPAPRATVTAYTLSLDTPERMGASAREHADRALLKLKLDRDDPVAKVRAVREAAPQARLIVDANEAWQPHDLEPWLAAMAELGVEMVEQPLPAGQDEALRNLHSPVPLGADESCHTAEDVDALVDRYQVANIKLDKTGGLTEALRLRDAALAAGLEIMVGCMVGTSLSMAPAMVVAAGARFVDLDGPLLLAQDRVPGLRYHGSTVEPPSAQLWG